MNGTLTVSSGTLDISPTQQLLWCNRYRWNIKNKHRIFDANNTFTASGGNITFTDAGFLKCIMVSSIGTQYF